MKDLDGDGLDDIVGGIPNYGTDMTGTAVVLLGKSVLTSNGALDAQIPPQEDGYSLGGAIATVDFNGDGYADIVTGSIGLNDAGLVHVFYGGSPLNLSATPETFKNPFPSPEDTRLGYALGVGDFDGDGFGDIIASAPFDSAGDASSGFVVVYFGKDNSASPPPTQISVQLSEGVEGNNFGSAVVGLGDIDGDGVDDFAVGSPGANKVFVYSGDPARKFKSQPTAITIAGASIGDMLAPVGDVNGDGYADLAIVDTSSNIYVFLGSSSGMGTTPVWKVSGVGASPVSILGDCQTGYANFAAGTGSISIFLGSSPPPATSTPQTAGGSFFLTIDDIGSQTWTGDVDGDGLPDLFTSRDSDDTALAAFLSHTNSTYPSGQISAPVFVSPKISSSVGFVFN